MEPHRPMTKRGLAQLYMPEYTPHSAVNRLMEWIHYNPKLMQELERTGYKNNQRHFTREQVELIYEYIGEP